MFFLKRNSPYLVILVSLIFFQNCGGLGGQSRAISKSPLIPVESDQISIPDNNDIDDPPPAEPERGGDWVDGKPFYLPADGECGTDTEDKGLVVIGQKSVWLLKQECSEITPIELFIADVTLLPTMTSLIYEGEEYFLDRAEPTQN